MKRRLLNQVTIALAVAAVAVPLAHATGRYDGYKSSYPQLHQLGSDATATYDGYKSSYPQLHQLSSDATATYDGYKSSYPQLHQLSSGAADLYDGYKSSYLQLHAVLTHQVAAPLAPTVGRGFDWSDAAIGAGTGAGAMFLIAAGALFLSRRHTRFAL